MKSHVLRAAARRLGITLFLTFFSLLFVTLCWAMVNSARQPSRPASSAPVRSQTPAVVATVDQEGNVLRSVATRTEGVDTPGLVNLTNSNADERSPIWSPRGDRLAFLSNGGLSNGVIGAPIGDGSVYSLYTMDFDGGYGANLVSHAQRFPAGASILSISWDPAAARNTLYVVAREAGVYKMYMLALSPTPVITLLHESSQEIGRMTPRNAEAPQIFFERMGIHGQWEICELVTVRDSDDTLMLTPPPVPEVWLTATGVDYRRPVLFRSKADNQESLLFDANISGASRIYRINANDRQSAPQQLVSNDDAAAQDYQVTGSSDGETIMFTSTRATATDDTTRDTNIWTTSLRNAATMATVVTPRFFTSPLLTTNEQDADLQPEVVKANSLLFVSTRTPSGRHDIFAGVVVDNEPPYIISAPVAKSPTGSKVGRAGDVFTISVRVRDQDTGVRRVWTQIKDPDTKALDELGREHVITREVYDEGVAFNDMWDASEENPEGSPWSYPMARTTEPLEYGVLDPRAALNGQANAYPPLLATSREPYNDPAYPGYYAGAGLEDTQMGYPQVSPYWIEMVDDGTNGDVQAGDGIYTCRWQTPSWGSDWVIDIIVEDDVRVEWDQEAGQWAGNRQRYDNVGGCSTRTFVATHTILFVDDYADGHKFLSRTNKPLYTHHTEYCYLNAYYYFAPVSSAVSPFLPDGEFGGVDIWRVLCRGAITNGALDSYKPGYRSGQVSATDKETPIDVKHTERMVVWVAPAPDGRIRGGDPISGNLMASGSITEEAVRNRVAAFTQAGGHIWMIGNDLPSSMQEHGSASQGFMSNVFGVGSLLSEYTYDYWGETRGFRIPGYPMSPPLCAMENWYGMSLSFYAQRWKNPVSIYPTRELWRYGWFHSNHDFKTPDPIANPLGHAGATVEDISGHYHNVLISNANRSQFDAVHSSIYGFWNWDRFTPAAGAQQAFAVGKGVKSLSTGTGEDPGTKSNAVREPGTIPTLPGEPEVEPITNTVGVSKVLANSARTVFWSFGYEHLSAAYRHRVAGDTIEWLLDGSIRGQVTSMATNAPIGGALIAVNGPQGQIYARTNPDGTFMLYGLQPGDYSISAAANGFYRSEGSAISVSGGEITDNSGTKFRLQLITGYAVLHGQVTRLGNPMGEAKVQLRAVAGEQAYTQTTDITGTYRFESIVPGEYKVTVIAPGAGQETMELPETITLTENETRLLPIVFGQSQQQGTLSGKVENDETPAKPVSGATVRVIQGETVLETTTDATGTYVIELPAAGTYTVQALADGHVNSAVQTVEFDPAMGATLDLVLSVIAAERKAHIYGRVVTENGQPVADARVTISGAQSSTFMTAGSFSYYSGTHYNFSALNLPAGTYEVTIAKVGYRTVEETLTLQAGETKMDFEVRMATVLSIQPGLVLLSLPGDYGAYDTPDVFATNRAAITDRLATYSHDGTPSYRYYPDDAALQIQPGQGYWLRAGTHYSVGMEGEPLPLGESFRKTLHAGWNMIGNPFTKGVSISACKVEDGDGMSSTWAQAVQRGLVGNTLHGWNGLSYRASITLDPYKGYWLYADEDATLVIPYPTQKAPMVMPTPPRTVATRDEWRVGLRARAGALEDAEVYFGVAGNATQDFDPLLDSRKPPQPCGPSISMALLRHDWGSRSGEYMMDIRAPFTGEQRWTLRVTTDVPNANVVLNWPAIMTQLPHGYQAVLIDAATRQPVCYLNTARQYAFQAGASGAQREFEIVVSPRTTVQPPEKVRAVSRDGGAVIMYTLSSQANITATIRAMNGRLVRRLTTAQPVEAGDNLLQWDGRSQTGARVAPGSYTCELVASDAMGRTTRVVTTVIIPAQP